MNKVILNSDQYKFSAKAGQVEFVEVVDKKDILLITNVSANTIIYNFACTDTGGILFGNKITLDYDTTSMSDSDELQIVVYSEQSAFEASSLEYLKEISSSLKTLNGILEAIQSSNNLIKELL